MPEEITYIHLTNRQVAVYLPNGEKRKKKVGHIILKEIKGQNGLPAWKWQYTPLGKKRGGEMFSTLAECQRSLGPTREDIKTLTVALCGGNGPDNNRLLRKERQPKTASPPLIPREQVTFTKALELSQQRSKQ